MNRSLPINLQTLVDSHDQPYQIIDQNRRVIAVNDACLTLLGVGADDALGQTCYQLNHGRDRDCTAYGEDCPHDTVFRQHARFSKSNSSCAGCQHPILEIAIPLTTSDGRLLMGKALLPEADARPPASGFGGESLVQFEQRQIRHLLTACGGNRRRVAVRLGISERTLYRRLKYYGIG